MRLNRVHMWLVGVFIVSALFHTYPASGALSAVLDGAPPGFDIQDVGVNTIVTFHPVYLEGSEESQPEIVAVSRVRIPGWSRLHHANKFHHTFRVKIEVPTYRSLSADSKIYVCLDQDPSWKLGECRNGSWRILDKGGGSWTFNMSPFQEKFIDIRVTKSFSAPSVTISVQDEKSTFRLAFLGVGVALLTMAPIVSGWVPFYYGSAMSLGILMVVLVILYQGMKLLPTGRKSTLYIVLYGSLAGVGTVVLRYFSSLVSSILWEMGFSDDMYSPVAIFTGVGIALFGAWLGYMGVRKLVILEDGNIDEGIAVFVKWAIRVVGSIALTQSSNDSVFMVLALCGGWATSWVLLNVRVSVLDFLDNLRDFWVSEEPVVKGGPKKETKNPHMTQAQIDAIRRLPGTESLMISRQGLVHSPTGGWAPGMRKKRYLKTGDVFPSTFHNSPEYRPLSKQEYADSAEYSHKAVDDLMQSKKYLEWRESNRHRVVIEPNEHRQERPVEEIEQTAFLEEVTPNSGFFGHKKKKYHY